MDDVVNALDRSYFEVEYRFKNNTGGWVLCGLTLLYALHGKVKSSANRVKKYLKDIKTST